MAQLFWRHERGGLEQIIDSRHRMLRHIRLRVWRRPHDIDGVIACLTVLRASTS